MANIQKISFLLRHNKLTLPNKCLRNSYRRVLPLHTQSVPAFYTARFSSFSSCNNKICSSIKVNKSTRHYCSVVNEKALTKEEVDTEIFPLEKFTDINLSDGDLLLTFAKLINIAKQLKKENPHTFQSEILMFISTMEFKNYCNSLEQKLPILTPQELKMLLQCDLLLIPPSSSLLQKVYHLITEKINEYSAVEALAMYKTLDYPGHKLSKRSKILSDVCKKYFEIKLQGSHNKTLLLNELAEFCIKGKQQLKMQKKILNVIGEHPASDKNFHQTNHEYSFDALCNIISAFQQAQFHLHFNPMMFEMLIKRIKEASNFSQINKILRGYSSLLFTHLKYNEDFCNTLVDKSIKNVEDIHKLATLVLRFFQMEHYCSPLVEHLEAAVSNVDAVTSHNTIFKIAQALSGMYYHPLGYKGDDGSHINCIQALDEVSVDTFDPRMQVQWCMFLTILGCESKVKQLKELFKKIPQIYCENGTEMVPSTAEEIIILNAFVRKHFPEVPELPKHLLINCFRVLEQNKNSMVKTLKSCIPEGVKTFDYCTSSLHHCIDMAVLCNGDNTSTNVSGNPLNSLTLKIEDINRPPSSQLILFQSYKHSFPCQYMNSSVLPGRVQLYLDSFEQFDCKVELIHEKYIRYFQPSKLLQYLSSKVKNYM